MKMFTKNLIPFILPIFLLSCNDALTNSTDNSIPKFSSYSSDCIVPNTVDGFVIDSIFNYTFGDTLSMDFSVYGNCCADSGAFILSYDLRNDTLCIKLSNLSLIACECICLYIIHVEVNGLPLDQYIVRCQLGDNRIYGLVHLVQVARNINS